ncbi:MAG: HlyD family efflux transporter periplasmic adaptor subunit [Lentimicrobiaceae bacterium]|nr:HlyD family efflux transporter periplasmic adaptor subunit [Lentimicrobiaceae bacterium]
MKKIYLYFIFITFLSSCSLEKEKSDAYGNFEATEITISAEATGKLLKFNIEEGQSLAANTIVGYIDSADISLKKQVLVAQRKAITAKLGNVASQVDVQLQQKDNLLIEKNRVEQLIKDNAATTKQLDDINASIRLVEKQIASIVSQYSGINEEIHSITKQIAQANLSLKKCILINPVEGTILSKYAEENEITTLGKALYKIADLRNIYLKVYISGAQLSSISLGQKVQVMVDKNEKENRNMEGIVCWISDKAEFTPKIIQTKEERVNLVYALKVRVVNDGTLKISMPGEVNFSINKLN